MAIIGKHQINLRVPEDSILNTFHFNTKIEFNETEYSSKKSFGTDTWVLNAGKVFSEILKMIDLPQNSNSSLQITNLRVLRFKKGLMQWSTHEITIGFDFELKENGSSIQQGEIEGFGSGRGSEFGILTFIPVLGNMNFDKGIEVALSRSIESGLSRLEKEIKF